MYPSTFYAKQESNKNQQPSFTFTSYSQSFLHQKILQANGREKKTLVGFVFSVEDV